MKRKIIAIGIIVMFLGTAIIQVGAEENNKIKMNENQFQEESEKNLDFVAFYAVFDFERVDNLELKGIMINKPLPIYLVATITGIANGSDNSENKIIAGSLIRRYSWEDGEEINIKCNFFYGPIIGRIIPWGSAYFVRVYK